MGNTEQVDVLFNELEEYIRDALDILDKGEYVELKTLEPKIAHICQEVMNMPLDIARGYIERMNAASKQLDILKQVMIEHKMEVASQVNSIDDSRRAHQAYARSETMAPAAKIEETDE